MKNRKWLHIYLTTALAIFIAIGAVTAYVDPFMHYHAPYTNHFFYTLNNERSQNDGILKHFDYDGVITGSSMTENFRTSEADQLYRATFIKVPFAGASFKEINDNLETAFDHNPDIRYVIRCLDPYGFIQDKDAMSDEMGTYPYYLYDHNPFNDVEYLFNRDVLYTRIWSMAAGKKSGITSFDDYANWMDESNFGIHAVWPDLFPYGQYAFVKSDHNEKLTDVERKIIQETVKQNVTDLADEHQDTVFYYFIPPYSAAYWGPLWSNGTFEKELEIQKYAAELIIPHTNIHLFAWDRFDILDDLNNYRDKTHYGEWVNSWMLVQMKQDNGRLTAENYKDYFKSMHEHYDTFNYESMLTQEDYEDDYYAAGLLNQEITAVKPLDVNLESVSNLVINRAEVKEENNTIQIICRGSMPHNTESEKSIAEAMSAGDYCGIKFTIDVTNFRALVFDGVKTGGQGQPYVCIYDGEGNVVRSLASSYDALDNNSHSYALNLAGIYGNVTVIMNGGCIGQGDIEDSEYVFSTITFF